MTQTNYPKFSIGRKVTSKKTGNPVIGYIAGISLPVVSGLVRAAANKEEAKIAYKRWTELYPDWTDKFVYAVVFTKPMRTMSLSEFVEQTGMSEYEYEEQIPKASVASYPEDDLELVDEGFYVPNY